jgi:hypothetical protein
VLVLDVVSARRFCNGIWQRADAHVASENGQKPFFRAGILAIIGIYAHAVPVGIRAMNEKHLARSATPRKDIPGDGPSTPDLLAMVVALTGELVVARERIDTLERLIEAAGVLSRDDIEAFQAPQAATEERRLIRKRIMDKTFRPLRDAAERDVRKAGGPEGETDNE